MDALGPDVLAVGAAWYVVLILSLTVHEACHALAALRGGDRTAYLGGQVSLDPLPHIRREPFGTVLVPLLSFAWSGWMIGWASTPYDPRWAAAHPRRAALMSLAGPAGNLALLLLAAAAIRAGVAVDAFTVPEYATFSQLVVGPAGSVWGALALLLSILFSLNLVLFVFNLFPVPPLDGSGALPLLIPDAYAARRVQAWLSNPSFALLGLLLAWYLFPSVFRPVYGAAVDLLFAGAF